VLDTIALEKKGKPAAVVGQDKLVNTTGKAMARVQGYAKLPFAVFPYAASEWGSAASDEELKMRAETVAPQVEKILTGLD
jgi:aspartate-semialdehyde dehydrogenase